MIKAIDIENIKGIERLSVTPGVLTLLLGENGSGKTSFLDALSAPFTGGFDGGLLRHGAKKGSVVITFDTGHIINWSINANNAYLKVTSPDGSDMKSPKAFVERMASGFGFDPLGFISADKKRRAQWLLEAMPIKFTRDEIQGATKVLGGKFLPADSVDLDGLAKLDSQARESRTNISRAVRDDEGARKDLRGSLREDDKTDWDATITDLQAKIDDATKSAQAKVNASRSEMDRNIEAIRAETEKLIAIERGKHSAQVESITNDHSPVVSKIKAAITSAQERKIQHAANAGIRRQLELLDSRIKRNAGEVDELDRFVDGIAKLRQDKLANLPLQGVTVRAGEVYLGETSFDHLSTAAQFLLAFQIAALKPGESGVMIADRVECLDSTQRAEFEAAAKESGFQVFAAVVSDGPLLVQSAV